jgi:hypothetical protein
LNNSKLNNQKFMMDEIRPILQFLGGLVAGLLRLNLNEDPLKSWLTAQGVATAPPVAKKSGPQSISID